MAQDDPVPGSSWNGGHWPGVTPSVKPKAKTSGKNISPMEEIRNPARYTPQYRQRMIQQFQNPDKNATDYQRNANSRERRKAIAMWQNRQDA